jgi:hypothetical protein
VLKATSVNALQIAKEAAFLRRGALCAVCKRFALDESSSFVVVTGLTVPESFV